MVNQKCFGLIWFGDSCKNCQYQESRKVSSSNRDLKSQVSEALYIAWSILDRIYILTVKLDSRIIGHHIISLELIHCNYTVVSD